MADIENLCWLCLTPVSADEAVTVDIDGAEEMVHAHCREDMAKSIVEAE